MERVIGKTLTEVEACHDHVGREHMARYRWACENLSCGRLLDCACGVGYGTAMMADTPGTEFVVGGDISQEAIDYANKYYSRTNIEFRVMDMTKCNDIGKFDTIVSLETIEHVPNPEIVLARFKKMLNIGGRVIASVPIIRSLSFNPFHLWEVPNEKAASCFFESNGFCIMDRLNQSSIHCSYLLRIL